MQYPKHELIEKLGEPAEESTQNDPLNPSTLTQVLRWNCGCGAGKVTDELLFTWDGSDCPRHAGGLPENLETVKAPEPDFG